MRRDRRSLKTLVALGSMLVIVGVVFASAAISDDQSARAITPAPAFSAPQLSANAASNWISVHGDLSATDFSTLSQITPSNVSTLKPAWSAHLGGLCTASTQACSGENNGLVYEGVMYINDGAGTVDALDAASGQQIWQFRPTFEPGFTKQGDAIRGMAMGEGKVFVPQIDNRLNGIDMQSGALIWSTSLGDWRLGYHITAAPVYYAGLVLVGVSGGDTGNSDYLVALDAASGTQIWRFNVIPSPGQPGYNTWGNKAAYHYGGGALWGSVSIDPKLGLVYLPTGNPVPWNSAPAGKELFTESIVALRAQTGKVVWSYQTTHHDIWDDDNMLTPVLFDAAYRPYKILKSGSWVRSKPVGVKVVYTGLAVVEPALAMPGKQGLTFILNRKTGKPLIPTPEMKVDQTNSKGLNLWPTQPIPLGDPITDQCAQASWGWTGNAPDFKPYAFGCTYTPYNVDQYVVVPHDSMEWAPSSLVPRSNRMYVCATEHRGMGLEAIPAAQQVLKPGVSYTGVTVTQGVVPPGVIGAGPGFQAEVAAIDLRTNKVDWRTILPDQTGPCYSGITATASGLLFVGRNDGALSALSASTGKELWRSQTEPSGANSPAITYSVNGKQYVSIFTAGNAHERIPRGDLIQTFVLP